MAFEQVKLLLNIQPDERSHLWRLWLNVNNGLEPTFNFDDQDIFTPFQESFNAASQAARIEYYGFDQFGWEQALPFIELSWQMDRIQDNLEDWAAPFIQLAIIGVLTYITAGLGAQAFAAASGGSITSTGAVITGGVTSSVAVTLVTGGDLDDALEGALLAALTAGLAELTSIPLASKIAIATFTWSGLAASATEVSSA